MGFYKNIFNKKIVIAGKSKGATPSYLMPPDATPAKQGYQIYEAVDLLCEGEVAGLVNQRGIILGGNGQGNIVEKKFNQEENFIGGTVSPIDQGIYFNENAVRDSDGNSTHSKYNIEFKSGKILQNYCSIAQNPSRLKKVSAPVKGPYSMAVVTETRSREKRTYSRRYGWQTTTEYYTVDVSKNGARTGSGSRDIREEGTSARDFVNWQKYVPIESKAKPYRYTNYDKDIDKIDVGLQIDSLSDTRSHSTKSENKAGKSKMGTPMPLTITFEAKVGHADKNGTVTISAATFTVRPGKGKTVGDGNGRLSVRGIITAPYTITLEDITLPQLSDTDLYNFVEIHKIQYETISNLVNRNVGVGTITEKYLDTYYYPGSCYVASKIDSQYHPQVPSRTFRIKGKKIKIPSNYNPIVANSSNNTDGLDNRFWDGSGQSTRGNVIYNGSWDGTFKYEWSDNPAWIYYDLLTNKRYGLGSYLQDIDIIDKWTLYEIGMYCDAVTMNDGSKTTNDMGGPGRFIGVDDGFGGLEPRFSCNILMKDQTNAFDAIQNLARSFRAMTYFNNSCVSVRVDRPYFFEDVNNTSNSASAKNKFPPHLIFNNLNIKDGMFAYADVDRSTKLSAVEVSFLDKRNNFTSQTEYVEDPEAIKHVGLNFKQIEGIGVTSKAQAHRLAKYVLFESQHTTETVSFNAGLEALLVQPGDIIRVEDEMRNFTRNYGTVLGASGLTTYYDPDGTTANGKGPTAIIVEPAIGSDLTQYVNGGNIHIYNPVGKSGIDDFYQNPNSNNELYKEIHNPQVISLKIKPGGLGTSYEIVDSGVAFFINGSDGQWFSEKDANIKHGSIYNVDGIGRDPKYYRVLNISEDKNIGFNVSATIHHTGKFKFVEENISFDVDNDAFQPNLQLTQVVRPDPPSSITNVSLVNVNSSRAKNLSFTINDPTIAEKAPEKYIVVLEEPDSTTIVTEHFKSNGTQTDILLTQDSKIDQLGNYNITVFSENTTPTIVRSQLSTNVQFSTTTADFQFANQDQFTEYSNIFIETDFSSEFSNVDETGVGQNSFFQNDPSINAVVNLEFEDIFGNSGFLVQQTIEEQIINILDVDGNVKSGNFKTLTNDSSFTILNEEINEAFGYTGDEKYRIPTGLNFEVASFNILSGETSEVGIFFESEFDETPAVFIQPKVTGSFGDEIYRPLGRRGGNSAGTNFLVKSFEESLHDIRYTYLASKTGNFTVDAKKIKIDFVSRSSVLGTGYQTVTFDQPFASIPTVVIQLQQADTTLDKETNETCITGVSTHGFSFAAFQDNGTPAGGTGKYAYIAVDQLAFNNTTATDLPVNVINYASTGDEDYLFGTPILNEFNGSELSVTNSIFNHDQYAVLCQRSGEDAILEDKFFVVHEISGQNKVHQHMLTSGLDTGISASQTNGADNHILLTGADLTVGTGDFTMFAWAKFGTALDGKQYLLESHKDGTGIAWFQSGDGKNYINLNGVDYLAITGAVGASLNDGNLHALYVEVDRDLLLKGYVDGELAITDTQIIEHSTGFTVSDVGSGMPQNTRSFDGTYTGSENLYQNTEFTGLRIKTSGTNNTWVLCDDDPAISYKNLPIAWSGGEDLANPSLVTPYDATETEWSGGAFFTGFTMIQGIGSGMSFNPNDFDGDYTGSADLYQNTTTSGLRLKTTGANNTWVFCDDDPANIYITGFDVDGIGTGIVGNSTSFDGSYIRIGNDVYENESTPTLRIEKSGTNDTWIFKTNQAATTGFRISSVGTGMVNNPNSFDGTYTGTDDLFVNTQTSGLRVKKVGGYWILIDENTANTYFTGFFLSAVGSGMTDNPNAFNGTYTGGADLFVHTSHSGLRIRTSGASNTWILTDDDPSSPSYNGIAWSGGANVNFPGNVTDWQDGDDQVGPSSPVFSQIRSHDRIAWTSVDQNVDYPFNVNSWSAKPQTVTNSSAPFFDQFLSAGSIAWSGGPNVIYPWDVNSWTGGASILNQLVTDSNSPNFDSFISHDKIAWSGGENVNYPWDVAVWTGGETISNNTITNSTNPINLFTSLLSGPHPGSNAPTFSDFLLDTFDSNTGFKVLGNSELPGNALTSGLIMKYIGLTTGQETQSNHFNDPNTFKDDIEVLERTKFLLDVESELYFEDISTDNTASGSVVGSIEKSQAIINRNKLANFNFLQIGVTGIL